MKTTPAKTPAETITEIVANSKPHNLPVTFQETFTRPANVSRSLTGMPCIMDDDDAHRADTQKLRSRIAKLEKAILYADKIALAWMQDEKEYEEGAAYGSAEQFHNTMQEAIAP